MNKETGLLADGLIKKTLRKFEKMALRNEINVTEARKCNWLVSPAKARLFVTDGTDFISAIVQIFSLFYEALIFLVTSLHQGKEVNTTWKALINQAPL